MPIWNMPQGNNTLCFVKSIYSREHRYAVEQLKKIRRQKGYTQGQVAKLLGTTQSYISKLESGQFRIDVVLLKSFSRIYKKDVSFFIKR
ncbi:helix-turn-helix domain-containing protein [Candidatus Mycalebacterium sp.]